MHVLTMPDHTGVFVDALLRDQDGSLLFASLWARDMPALELLSRIQLGDAADTEDAAEPTLEFSGAGHAPIIASIRYPERFLRHQGRMPPACVFGSLTHTWIYDRLLLQPDLARQRAVLLCRELEDAASRDQRLWELLLRTCSVPLLRPWKDPVLAAFRDHGFITRIDGFRIHGIAVQLTSPEEIVGELVRSRRLGIEGVAAC